MLRAHRSLCALSIALVGACADGVSVGSYPLDPRAVRTAGNLTPNAASTSAVVSDFAAHERPSEKEHPFVLDLAAGAAHACVRTFEGYVRCWGSNEYGQLGRAPSDPALTPQVAGRGALALHLFAGPTQTAVLDKSRQIGHWGLFAPYNEDGVTPWSRHDTQGVGPLAGVAFGDQFAIAWDEDGKVIGWGAPDETSFRSAFIVKPVVIVLGFNVSQAAVWSRGGHGHGCLVIPDGTAACWGRNDRGQLGASRVFGIFRIQPLTRVTAMSVGDRFSCATRDDASAWCWGANDAGQLGDETARDHAEASRVRVPAQILSVSTGARHACALTRDGSVWCWGANDHRQLGVGSVELFSVTPLRVVGLPKATAVSLGDDFSCARTEDGRVWCWGNNDVGQLGDGSVVTRAEPRPIAL